MTDIAVASIHDLGADATFDKSVAIQDLLRASAANQTEPK
jgi:hypothetical protein